MQKKHQEFFRKLRDLCGEYNVIICAENDDVDFVFDKGDSTDTFGINDFSEHTETMYQYSLSHHSISSEAKDEGEK